MNIKTQKIQKTQKNVKLQEILKKNYDKLTEDELHNPADINKFEKEKELFNNMDISLETKFNYLYPSLDDKDFSIKIAEKKEFFDTKYDGSIKDVITYSDTLCNMDFELSPHQIFVRNFLSFQTPYNSVLLYHGLGSGKTCSAISVAEEMRGYLNQMGLSQRIIIVASPIVQENFKLQLFDERKLEYIDGLWNIRSCTGNIFLKEINPMNMKGISKEKIISQIKHIINASYLFLGYIEFANYISKKSLVEGDMNERKRNILIKKKLNKNFNNRLIIIDEIHNIRMSDDNKDKRVANELQKLVDNVDYLRLLLLSGTPMYNSYKEIIWLINLMNKIDKRSTIEIRDVFNSDGSFKTDDNGKEIGRELLERKATGYISFVRGENPYTFPYRIFPSIFSPTKSILNMDEYPLIQLNGKPISQGLELIDLYMNKIGSYQQLGYEYILQELKQQENNSKLIAFENMERFGYTILQKPIQSLNIVYPDSNLNKILENDEDIQIDTKNLVGSSGLNRIMKYVETTSPPSKKDFEYKTLEFGKIFSKSEIGKYSSKIESICNNILNSTGIILIYSEYIDGGLIPMALALEELGFRRYNNNSLFKTHSTAQIDALEFKTKANYKGKVFNPAHYVIISGDKYYSPDNVSDLKALTNNNNTNGEKIKVVLISQAGAEGLDFKNLRQIHILEPWYNMNRIEQIIGRGIRNCSHKNLSFQERNVSIYLYGTILEDPEEEAADLYIYRLAEKKAIQIGNVSRVLKKISIDCILNSEQMNFSVNEMKQNVEQHLSNKKIINYEIGDKPYSSLCDYMDKCNYTCSPNKIITEPNLNTFNEKFIFMNTDKIIQKIRELFKEKYFYIKKELIVRINVIKIYPLVQINAALNQLIEDKNEYISDMYGRIGNLINIDDIYLFQPLELTDEKTTIYDRSTPIDFKHKDITFTLPKEITTKNDTKLFKNEEALALVAILEENYLKATTSNLLVRGEDDWYKFYYIASEKMINEKIIDKNNLLEFLINHMIDYLNFDENLILLNYLYNTSNLSDLMKLIKNNYESKIIKKKGITGIVLYNSDNVPAIKLIVYKDNKWVIGEFTDEIDLKDKIKEYTPDLLRVNNVIGFIGNFKHKYMIFKVKFMKEKRNSGARCDQSGKKENIKILNEIFGEKDKFNFINTKGMNKNELCIRQEILLRLFNKENKNNKIWFLNGVESALIDIEKKTL